jgi:hypothetical protein
MDEADQSTRRTIACRALRSRGSSTSRWHRAPLWLCTTLYRRTGRTDPLLARRRATADARLRQHLPSCERVAGKSAEPDAALLLRPERPAMSTPAVPFVAKRKPAEFRSVDRPSVSWRAAVQLTRPISCGRLSGIPVVSPLERTLCFCGRPLPLIGVLASGRRALLLARSGPLSGSRWRSDLGDSTSERRELSPKS